MCPPQAPAFPTLCSAFAPMGAPCAPTAHPTGAAGLSSAPGTRGRCPGCLRQCLRRGELPQTPQLGQQGWSRPPAPWMEGSRWSWGDFCVPHEPEGPHSRGKVAQTERSHAATAGPRCSRGRRAPGAAQALALLPAPCRARALPSSGLCPAYRPGRAGVTPLSPLRAFRSPWRRWEPLESSQLAATLLLPTAPRADAGSEEAEGDARGPPAPQHHGG